jgi:hypothetical protein
MSVAVRFRGARLPHGGRTGREQGLAATDEHEHDHEQGNGNGNGNGTGN